MCLDWEIFNQDGIEREELGEAIFLLLPFVFLSVLSHFPQSRSVHITSSMTDCWTEAGPSSLLTYSHRSNIQARGLSENPSHPSWEIMIPDIRARTIRFNKLVFQLYQNRGSELR